MREGCDVDVVVVGAGIAGLAAAAELRREGLSVAVLEAGHRVGGRALTVTSPLLGGIPADAGAAWFHMAGNNPLVSLARERGLGLDPFSPPARLTSMPSSRRGGKPTFLADTQAREAADGVFEEASAAPDEAGEDMSVLDRLAAAGADDTWMPTIAAMEGPMTAAADLGDVGVADWNENALDDENLWVEGGVGSFVSTLSEGKGSVRLRWPVTSVEWDASFGGVEVSGPRGTVRARIVHRNGL